MAQARLLVLFLCCLLWALACWAQTTSPTLMATPPQPKWSELSVEQKIVLTPLSDDWDSLEYYRQKKWLTIVARFSAMTPAEQWRIQGQMQEWGKLTPEQRQLARENFRTASQLPESKKEELKKKWEEYSSLPDEEKEKLKQQALSKPVPKPGRPALPTPASSSPASPWPVLSAPLGQTLASISQENAVAKEPAPANASVAEAPAKP